MSNSVRPHRRQPTRLRQPWDSPGKNTGVGCYFLLQCMTVKSESEVTLSHVQLFATPWTVALQAPLSMGFSRQEYWNGLPFPSSRDLPNQGVEPGSPTLWTDSLLSELPGKPRYRGRSLNCRAESSSPGASHPVASFTQVSSFLLAR